MGSYGIKSGTALHAGDGFGDDSGTGQSEAGHAYDDESLGPLTPSTTNSRSRSNGGHLPWKSSNTGSAGPKVLDPIREARQCWEMDGDAVSDRWRIGSADGVAGAHNSAIQRARDDRDQLYAAVESRRSHRAEVRRRAGALEQISTASPGRARRRDRGPGVGVDPASGRRISTDGLDITSPSNVSRRQLYESDESSGGNNYVSASDIMYEPNAAGAFHFAYKPPRRTRSRRDSVEITTQLLLVSPLSTDGVGTAQWDSNLTLDVGGRGREDFGRHGRGTGRPTRLAVRAVAKPSRPQSAPGTTSPDRRIAEVAGSPPVAFTFAMTLSRCPPRCPYCLRGKAHPTQRGAGNAHINGGL